MWWDELREDERAERPMNRVPGTAIRNAFFAGLLAVILMTGCRPPGGGWDLEFLLRAHPELAAINGHRIGDMIPFPALDLDRNRVALLVCRFPSDAPIRVSGDGPGWPRQWAARAIDAMSGTIDGVELALERAGKTSSAERGLIWIRSLSDASARGPLGLADTLSECDVSPEIGSQSGFRGELLTSTIRIRRSRLDFLEESREATAEEWVGALMHELAHALGFSGHTRDGDSVLVLEQSRLRAAGRRALASESAEDPTLNALYALPVGQLLGDRSLTPASHSTLDEIRSFLEMHRSMHRSSVVSTSTVGDRAARIRWRLPDGSHVGVRFPRWRDELRSGADVTLVAEPATARRLEGHAEAEASGLLVDAGLDRSGSIDQGTSLFGLTERAHDDTQSE